MACLSATESNLQKEGYTTDLSPVNMKSTMMGCWLLCIALGGYLSSVLAEGSHAIASIMHLSQSGYVGQFLFISGVTFITALLLILSIQKLSKMMR